MDGVDKNSLFFILIMNLDLIAEAALSGDGASQAMESREKLAGLNARVYLKVYFITFFKLLEVLA